MAMSFPEALELIDCLDNDIAVMFVGEAGIGKSSIVEQYAASKNVHLEVFNCSEASELGDVLGLPDISGDHTIYKPPTWFDPTQDTYLFMDEINRAGAASIIKGMMGLTLNRRIGNLKLTPGSRIFSAINPECRKIYDVIQLDAAQKDRFWMCEVECSAGDWIVNFAKPRKLHQVVIDYIDEHRNHLHTLSNETMLKEANARTEYRGILSTPRSWERTARTLTNLEPRLDLDTVAGMRKASQTVYNMCCGFIGPRIARSFTDYYMTVGTSIRATAVLTAGEDDWDMLSGKLSEMSRKDTFSVRNLCDDVCSMLESSLDAMCTPDRKSPSDLGRSYAGNFNRFIRAITPELVSYLFNTRMKAAAGAKGLKWMNVVGTACPESMEYIKSVISKPKKTEPMVAIEYNGFDNGYKFFDVAAGEWKEVPEHVKDLKRMYQAYRKV